MELSQSECWTAVTTRDARYDGRFVYGVKTTGIFCRPSCPSRRAKRENVHFYRSPQAAQDSGLRACLRCRPEAGRVPDRKVERMTELARFIEAHADEELPLERLAERAGMSRFHLLRTFQSVLGVTPKEFQTGVRFERLKTSLRSGEPVLDAVFGAGFGSTSRVYERVDDRLGMTPSAYREGGQGEIIVHAGRETVFGWLLMAATVRGVCFAQFGERLEELEERLTEEFSTADLVPAFALKDREIDRWITALEEHLAERAPSPALPLDLRGTAFQVRVWRFLLSVRGGEVVSYSEVAQAIGAPTSARAVANACGANRVAVLVPCHRVLRGDGSLGGYRWGKERKRRLLDQEGGLEAASS